MRYPFDGSYRITQYFGQNPEMYARFGLKGHNGIDFGTPAGTEIRAVHSGKVIESRYDEAGYGLYVKIENQEEGSIYAHFSALKVNAGDTISEGQVVGISGNTGNSTAPHLHFGYYRMPRDRSNGYAGYQDPLPYLTDQPETIPVPKETFEMLVGKATKYDEFVQAGYPDVKTVNDIIINEEKEIAELKVRNDQLKKELVACENQTPPPPIDPDPSEPVPMPRWLKNLQNWLNSLGNSN